MKAYIQANTSGYLHDAGVASISPLDRGFLYGDAVYEVWRTYHGGVFAFDQHWARLNRSASALRMKLPLSRDGLLLQIRRTAGRYREHTGSGGDLYVRLQATRGSGRIGLDPGLAESPAWVILVQDLGFRAPVAPGAGLRVGIARELRRNPARALNPAWKTGNYLNNLLCLAEVRERGDDEVLILNEAGAICEASASNVFFVRGRVLITPPLSAGILGGVTRDLILGGVAPRAGLTVTEAEVRPDDLDGFGECFLTSSTRDVVPVRSIDGHSYATGSQTVSQTLKDEFAAFAADYALNHPELKV